MQETLGEALSEFDAALRRFKAALAAEPALFDAVFEGAQDWMALLSYKLVPHLAGEGCLVAAVAGGTNTGKSTVFNLLLGEDISPVRNTAAATCRPVLAGNARRYEECLEGKLVPEFKPRPLDDPDAVIARETEPEALFAVRNDSLPDRLVLLDTPDVDSIDRQNWEVADNIRAAGDLLIALLTAEKYKDDRVIAFFRGAHAAGREILPLMNKADPSDDFDIARQQLADFCADVGLDAPPCFAIAHDFSIAKNFAAHDITPLHGTPPLRAHLEALEVPAIKERVYRGTVASFAEQAGTFLENTRRVGTQLREIHDEFHALAKETARLYQPIPGAAVGGLFHEFIQSKRERTVREIGRAGAWLARGVAHGTRKVRNAVLRRVNLERPEEQAPEKKVDELQREQLENLARERATSYYNRAERLPEPAGRLIQEAQANLDVDAAVAVIVQQTIQAEDVSEAYRRHAYAQLELWWNEHPHKRQALVALDKVLMATPVAVAGLVGIATGGWGGAEAAISTSGVLGVFAAKVLEYQLGDDLLALVKHWQEEQQQEFEAALLAHLAQPMLHGLSTAITPFESGLLDELQQWRERCLNLSQT